MKHFLRFIVAVCGLALCAGSSFAQFTLVSGTVTDPNGLPWACGTISAQLVNNNGVSATLNGVSFSGFTAPVKLGCPTDPSTSRTPGFFQMQLADNTVIKCGIVTCGQQTTWLFTVNTIGIAPPQGTGPQSFTQAFTISGSSQTLSFSIVPALSLGSAGNSVGAIFSVLNYGWVDDDATDNCGAPVTNFMAAVNGYTGAGIAQALIPEGTAGKAFKLNSCNMVFTIPTTIMLRGTLDCGAGVTTTGCLILGPTNLVNFTNAQTPPYTLEGTGAIAGCANVTVACVIGSLWVSQPRIRGIHAANVGAGNASPPACTNYFISFEGHNNAPQIIDTSYWNTDATTGRCWSINNRTATGGGTNSALIEHNTIIGAGAAPGFTTPCGSVGHSELGSATIIKGNQIYGFGQTVLLLNPMLNVLIEANQLDQAGCTAGVASVDIHYGNGSNLAVSGVQVVGSYFSAGGGGHAAAAIGVASGSTSAISGLTFIGNTVPLASGKNVFPSATSPSCSDCYVGFNPGFNRELPNASVGLGVATAGLSVVAQAANVAPTTDYITISGGAYRFSCYLVLTQAATTSSTLPNCSVKFTDELTSVVNTTKAAITWASGGVGCSGSATNTIANSCGGQVTIAAKSATNVQFCTGVTGCDANGTDYTSVGATPMQYTVYTRVEKLF